MEYRWANSFVSFLSVLDFARIDSHLAVQIILAIFGANELARSRDSFLAERGAVGSM